MHKKKKSRHVRLTTVVRPHKIGDWLGKQHREFLVIPKVGKKQEICGVFLGFGCNFPNWENATKTNVGFK